MQEGIFKVILVGKNNASDVEEFESLLNDGWRIAGQNAAIPVGDTLVVSLFKAEDKDDDVDEEKVKTDMFDAGVLEGKHYFLRKPWYVRLLPKLDKRFK